MPRYFPCPGIYQRDMKAFIHKNTCACMFITAIFIIAKTRSNSDLCQKDDG